MSGATTLKWLSFVVFLFILAPQYSAAQGPLYFTMGFESRYLSGSTTYHISFDDSWDRGGHGESELEFPVGNYFAGFNMSVYSTLEGSPLRTDTKFEARYLAAISGYAGVMKDSDWIENDLALCGSKCTENTSGRDLYTESEDTLTSGRLLDVKVLRNFWLNDSFALGMLMGYRYYEVNHDVKGCKGTYWGVPVSCVDASVLDYRAEHSMPYVGLGVEFIHKRRFRTTFMFAYSGWVSIDDRDVHLYPDSDTATYNIDKVSTCNCSGSAYLISLDTGWAITDGVGIFLQGDYMDVEADGYQTQRTYVNGYLTGINSIPIKDDISTTVWSAGVGLYYVTF